MDKLLTHGARRSGEPGPWHVQVGDVLSLRQEASFSVGCAAGRLRGSRLVFLAELVKGGCLNPLSQDAPSASSRRLLPWTQRPGCVGVR